MQCHLNFTLRIVDHFWLWICQITTVHNVIWVRPLVSVDRTASVFTICSHGYWTNKCFKSVISVMFLLEEHDVPLNQSRRSWRRKRRRSHWSCLRRCLLTPADPLYLPEQQYLAFPVSESWDTHERAKPYQEPIQMIKTTTFIKTYFHTYSLTENDAQNIINKNKNL